MSVSTTTMSLPPEGSIIRLVGLKNRSLNGAEGRVAGYTRDGQRVMIALLDKDGGVVKVKPRQIEPVDDKRRSRRDSGNGRSTSRRASAYTKSRSGSSVQDMGQELVETLKSADAMFDMADTDGNGWLAFDEFEYYMKRHTTHSTEMIQDVFRMIDKDGDGQVSKEEVRCNFFRRRRELREKNGGGCSDSGVSDTLLLSLAQDADKMFDKADVSGDGELSLREFQLYMKRHTKHTDIAIAELFSMMDADNDGCVTREEVRRVFLKQKQQQKMGNGKPGMSGPNILMGDLLGLKDDDMAELCDDVYSMFFLANLFSQSFWYALFIFILKQTLIMMIAIDLYVNKSFPANSEVPLKVRSTQFLLMPVNFALQEELVVTFFIYGNIKWHEAILELNPGASKWKYHLGNMFRLLDGLSFLFINTTVMLQGTDILSMFLNFAALQFLQSIDNKALDLAKDGYLSESLEEVANSVHLMRLPKNNNETLQVMDSCMMLITFIVLMVSWLAMILRG